MLHLSLEKFEALFHLFAGYYLLLGTFFDKFDYYFGFSDLLKKYKNSINLTDLNTYLDIIQSKKNELQKTKLTSLESKDLSLRLKIFEKWDTQDRKFNRYITQLKKAVKMVKRGEKVLTFHTVDDEKTHSVFFKFFKFYYIISGCFCVNVLLIQGYIEEWDKFVNLEFVNILQAIITIYVIARIFFRRINEKFLGTENIWTVIIYIGSLFLLLNLIPSNLIGRLIIWNFHSGSIAGIDFNDVQILLTVFLGFVPIIIHNLYLFTINRSCRTALLIKNALDIAINYLGKSDMDIPILPA